MTYTWREDGRYLLARCNLCGRASSDPLRSALQAFFTAPHRRECPTVVAWQKRQDEAFLRSIGAT